MQLNDKGNESSLGKLLTEKEVAEILVVSLPTLRRWRYRDEGPPWVKLSHLCRYPQDWLQIWLALRRYGAAHPARRAK
jgi:hypothetical protein